MNKANVIAPILCILLIGIALMLPCKHVSACFTDNHMFILLGCVFFTCYQWKKYVNDKSMRWWLYGLYALLFSSVVHLAGDRIGIQPNFEIIISIVSALLGIVFIAVNTITKRRLAKAKQTGSESA